MYVWKDVRCTRPIRLQRYMYECTENVSRENMYLNIYMCSCTHSERKTYIICPGVILLLLLSTKDVHLMYSSIYTLTKDVHFRYKNSYLENKDVHLLCI
jgi:hypothetical protein